MPIGVLSSYITTHFQKKNLTLHQDFYNLYHEGFKIL